MKLNAPLLALALALCLGGALANDLQVSVKVYGCQGELLRNVTVRISGCVDDGVMGRGTTGITTKTNSDGIAFFKQRAENSIQYCWGSANNKCKIEVLSGAGSATYATLGLVNRDMQLVSPRDYLCQMKGCCHPCAPNNAAESFCTPFIDYGMLEFRPTGGCPRSCCAEECTVRVRVGFSDLVATGTCSGRFAEMNVERRRSLLQAGGDVSADVSAATSDVLTEVPDDVIFLNDDGTVLKMANESTAGGRRLTTDDACPSGWLNSDRDCAVGGCGKCCIRRSAL